VGRPPGPDLPGLWRDLDAGGYTDMPVRVSLVVGGIHDLDAGA
jgi:hypothetical protein